MIQTRAKLPYLETPLNRGGEPRDDDFDDIGANNTLDGMLVLTYEHAIHRRGLFRDDKLYSRIG